MDRLAAMQAFVRVVEAGSFSAVARALGTTQSGVSKQVAALESHLGIKLLSRTTRAVSLTDEGRAYFENAQRIVRDVSETEDALRAGAGAVTGRLRLGGSVGFGRRVLFDVVREFMALHPGLAVDLHLSDGFVDVVAEGLDVAIRIGELSDSSLLAQRVGTTHRAVVASKTYAAKLAKALRLPAHPADLALHDCIIYSGLSTHHTWVFDAIADVPAASVKVQGRISSNSSEVVREAVLAHMGLGFTPTWLFVEELANGEVVRLLPHFSPHPLPINAVYPQSRRHSVKVTAFIQFVKTRLASQ